MLYPNNSCQPKFNSSSCLGIIRILIFTLCSFFLSNLYGASVWTPPALLLKDCHHKSHFSLSINTSGSAIVGWFDESSKQIEIARYDFIQDKLQPPEIVYPTAHHSTLLKILIAENNDLFVLWIDESEACLKASVYDAQKGIWTHTISLPESNSIHDPVMKIDSDANAMLVWTKFTGYEHQVQAVYYDRYQKKWSEPTTLSPVGYDCHLQKFAFDSQGNAVAVWKALLFTQTSLVKTKNKSVQAVHFDGLTQTWSHSLFFSDFASEFVPMSLDIAFDLDDNLIILWYSKNPATNTHAFQFVSYSTRENKWGNKTLIETEEDVQNPILVNNHRHLFAIWQAVSDQGLQLKSIALSYPGSRLAEKLDISFPPGIIKDFKLTTDHFGKMKILFVDGEGITISEFSGIWEKSAKFNNLSEVKNLQIEGDALGNALAVWENDNLLFYSRGDYLLPPNLFSAQISRKRFTAKVALRAVLDWHPSQSPSIARYVLRRNEKIIAEIPVHQKQFIDKFLPRGKVTYSISAINHDNLESQLSEFTVRN